MDGDIVLCPVFAIHGTGFPPVLAKDGGEGE